MFQLRISVLASALFALLGMSMLAAAPARAQIIEEDEVYSEKALGDFFGRASAAFSGGGSVSANYQALQVGFDTAFARERGRLYFSGLGSNAEVDMNLSRKSSCRNDCATKNPETEQTLSTKENAFDVRDAFLQFDLADSLEFTLGRRRVSWGQFDLFSPVNLVLPLTPQSAEPVIDKVNSLVAQDQAALSLFPFERMEINVYQFFNTRLDPLIEKFIEQDQDGMGAETVERITDHDQFGARVMFYPSWGVFGFSYLDGVDALAYGSDLATLSSMAATSPEAGTEYTKVDNPDLPEAKSYGFELAIPAGDWVWKLEVLQQESTVDLAGSNDFIPTAGASTSLARYYNAVLTDARRGANAGNLYTEITRTLVGLGFDVDGDFWRVNLGIIAFLQDFEEDYLIELEEAANFDEGRDDQFAPVFNIARYIGGNKNKELGALAGFFGSYLGASTYYTSTIGDNFRWTLGAEAISNLRDDLLLDTNANDDAYELEDDFSIGGRFSFIYSF